MHSYPQPAPKCTTFYLTRKDQRPTTMLAGSQEEGIYSVSCSCPIVAQEDRLPSGIAGDRFKLCSLLGDGPSRL